LRGVKDKTALQRNNEDGSPDGCRFIFPWFLFIACESRFEVTPKVLPGQVFVSITFVFLIQRGR